MMNVIEVAGNIGIESNTNNINYFKTEWFKENCGNNQTVFFQVNFF